MNKHAEAIFHLLYRKPQSVEEFDGFIEIRNKINAYLESTFIQEMIQLDIAGIDKFIELVALVRLKGGEELNKEMDKILNHNT